MNRYPLLMMVAMLGLCWGLHWLYPAASGFGVAGQAAGCVVVLCGITLIAVAGSLFKIKGTTVNPTREPAKLVTEGLYRVTRNPMYLGMLMILSGFPFIVESMPGLIFPVIFFLMMDRVIIPREEKMVESVFGEVYRRYKSGTRRWI